MSDEPTDDIELLHQLLTSRKNWSDVDEINSRPDPGVELRFDVPDGDGCVYVQCQPFAVQAYAEGTDNDTLFDATWDELTELSDGASWKIDEDDVREYVEERRVQE